MNAKGRYKAVVIGIKPSIADDRKSDVTLTKISRYLYQYDVRELTMINLFETISTNQAGINYSDEINLGKHHQLLEDADMIVVAWGYEHKYMKVKQKASAYLLPFSKKVYCIEDKNGNKPRHPSRLAYDDSLVYFFEDPLKKRYPIITLCGSTRFKNEFMEVQKKLTLEGNIVISVGLFGHAGDEEVWDGMDEGTLSKTKEMLDDMHKRKIDMADGIFVVNVDGYIARRRQGSLCDILKRKISKVGVENWFT